MADAINFVDANGLRFGYLEEGSGPLVLLLHGFPDTAHTWDELRPRIAAKGYRAVSPFMRGYAPSGIPDRDTDQETLARDPLALIEALGARDAIVIGHDFGASAAYGAAALGPDRVKKLFAIAIPHPATLKPSPKKLWGRATSQSISCLVRRSASRATTSPRCPPFVGDGLRRGIPIQRSSTRCARPFQTRPV